MKKLYFIFLLFVSLQLSAQTKGITYQAVIYNPSGESLPGVNNPNAPMANKNVCLQFSILDASSQIEYQESISTTTDEFGMVNLVIGNGLQTDGYATSFSNIAWSADQKKLKVALDVVGQCFDFVDISIQKFEAVPYAFSANSADNLTGILPIENGGTNASTVSGALTNLGLENVDNTSDLNKPISNATQAALDLKEDKSNKSTATTLGTSDVLYPTQNAVKTYVDATTTNVVTVINNDLATEIANRINGDQILTTNLANEVTNRINADNILTTNLSTETTNRINADNTLTTNLGAEVVNRINGDNTLTTNLSLEVSNRTNADLLKEDLSNKSASTALGTSNTLYPTQNAVKSYVDATATANATALNNEAVTRAAADAVLTNNLATEVANRTNADLLKENTANKSTATTLGTSDVLFPTQNAVKTYVDASTSAGTNGLNNEAAIRAAADVVLTNNLATEVTNRTNADLLKENTANKSTATTLGNSDVLFPTQNAVKTYVDAGAINATNALNNEAAVRAAADLVLTNNLATEVSNRTNADATLTTNIAAEAAARTAADATLTTNIAAVQADVDANETATTTALGLKENAANKSTATTLGTSDVLFPTQNAVKTYVDANTSAGTIGLNNEAAIRAAADVVLTNNLATEASNRTNADATLTTNLAAEAAARTAADATLTTNIAGVQADLDAHETATILALGSKENAANKSTSTSLGTSDVLFPTQNAVKTYVDASTAAGSTGLNNEAAIRAAADILLTNNLATEVSNRINGETSIMTNLAGEVSNRTNADATLTTNLATETANRTAADLLKENTANKSTDVVLDAASDVKFPSVKSVKTYVDGSITTANAATTTAITNLQSTVTSNAAATTTALGLKEDAANKSTATTLGTSNVLFPTQNAVKTYVDAGTTAATTALNNEAAIRAAADVTLTNDLATEVSDRTSADATLTTNLAAEVTNRTNADATLTTNLATETANRTAADLLKENTANKSTDVVLDAASDVKFPSVKSVKTYVDGSITTANAATTTAITNLQSTVTSNAAATTTALGLKEDAANKSTATTLGTSDVLFPTQNAVKTYVDAGTTAATTALNNEAAIRAAADVTLTNDLATEVSDRTSADATLTTNLAAEVTNRTNADATLTTNLATETANRTAADLLKENTANKSTDVVLDAASDVKFPSVKSVKTYVDGSITTANAATTTAITNLQSTVTSNAAATTTALGLKEDAANKSTATSLGTSDVLFPTQNAVKTYVDAGTTAATTALNNEAAIRAAADITLTNDLATEVSDRTSADATLTTNLAAVTTNLATETANRTAADLLKENTANKSTDVVLDAASDVKFPSVKSVKTYVDGSITTANAATTTAITNLQSTVTSNAAATTTALGLKEDAANKSTATTLGTSDVLFPTQNAVKTYVDAGTTAATTALNNEAAIRAAADVTLTNDLATEVSDRTSADATLTTNLAAEVTNRTSADATLTTNLATETANRTAADLLKENTANKSTDVVLDAASDVKFPSVKSVKTYVDGSITTANAATTTAITNLQSTVTSNAAATTTALGLKEDAANKSTATTLGTSDVLFPTQNAVKTYVDAGTTAATTALNNEAAIRAAADVTLTNDLATEVSDRTSADATLTTNLAAEVTNRTNADATLTTNLATETANRTAADLLKENTANKSTDVVLDAASDVKFPSVKSVKTYVDGSITTANAATTTAITNLQSTVTSNAAATTTALGLKEDAANKSTATTLGTSDVLFPTQNAVKTYVDAGTTAATTALNNEAAIRAAADVTLTNDLATEVSDRTNADATLTTNLAAEVTNRTSADATLTTNLATETANRTAADLLKENTANKSIDVVLDAASDVKFPSVKSVKTYVDGSITTANAATTTAITNLQSTVTSNAAATTTALGLKEDAANKSTATILGTSDVLFPTQNAVKTYVDASTAAATTALNNEAAIRAAADQLLTNNLASEVAARSAADVILTNNIATEETNRTNADLLKENTANKSTDVVLDAASDVKFPSVKAVKTYVDTYSLTNSISTVSGNYTALMSDYTILTNSTMGSFTLTLPSAASSTGKVYVIRKIDETNNLLNFSPALKLTETTTISSINFPKTIRIQSNGTSWYVID